MTISNREQNKWITTMKKAVQLMSLFFSVGTAIDPNTGRVVQSDGNTMASEKVWFAPGGSCLRLIDDAFEYSMATYREEPEEKLIYTYTYSPDMNWTTYNQDLGKNGWIGRDYSFFENCYFRVMVRRVDGEKILKDQEQTLVLRLSSPDKQETHPESYFMDEIEITARTIREKQKQSIDAALTVCIITDTHYAPGTTWNNSQKNIRAVHEKCRFDSIIHLGDLTDGIGSKALTKDYADHVLNGLRSIGLPLYLTVGNHDSNYFHHNPDVYSTDEQYVVYHDKDPKDINRDGTNLWYSTDRYRQKVRMLFLGSYDASRPDRYGFWEEEVEWVRRTLISLPPDWKVMVFSHLPLLPEMHYWSKDLRNSGSLLRVLKEFNKNGNRLLAYIHGHNHCD